MKFVCEKCGGEFENESDCSRHERICGLPESDICDMHFFEVQTHPVRFFDRHKRVPFSTLSCIDHDFDVPWEDAYRGDFHIRVEEKNKDNGLRKLFGFAVKKMQERIGDLQEQLQKIKELSLEKLNEEK